MASSMRLHARASAEVTSKDLLATVVHHCKNWNFVGSLVVTAGSIEPRVLVETFALLSTACMEGNRILTHASALATRTTLSIWNDMWNQ